MDKHMHDSARFSGDKAAVVALKTIQRFHTFGTGGPSSTPYATVTGLDSSPSKSSSAEPGKFHLPSMLVSHGDHGNTSSRNSEATGDEAGKGSRSLFLFSENNMLRKAAKAIIDWGYPFQS